MEARAKANEEVADEAPAKGDSPRGHSLVPRSLGRRSGRVPPERRRVLEGRSPKALLCVDGVSVSFDGFQALTDLTLVLEPGELRCIIGPNGAGKTTLMDVMTGKTKPDSGHVFFLENPDDLTTLKEHEIARRGIGRKFQRPTVFPHHTVMENLEVALAANKGVWSSLFFRRSDAQRRRVEDILETIGLAGVRAELAGGLAHGQKQWLEIGMLLAQNPRVLLVDEPIAGMTHQEVEKTAALLKRLAGEHTVVVIEHDMDFVREIVGDGVVSVLHEGKLLSEGKMDKVQNDPKVVEVYLGE